MSSFQLKMIAVITMLIDHIGVVIFPDIIVLRIIGRLAFPLFAFLITEGYRHTSNFNKYLARLALLAIVSQYPFWLAFGFDSGLNIFFTLALGLIAIAFSEKFESIIPVILLASLADILGADYRFFGVFLIYLIHHFRYSYKLMLISVSGLYGFFYLLIGLIISGSSTFYYIQLFALSSFIIIKTYNGEQGPKLKYFFYLFYPVHLLILGLLFR